MDPKSTKIWDIQEFSTILTAFLRKELINTEGILNESKTLFNRKNWENQLLEFEKIVSAVSSRDNKDT